ncbi:hypothetical protein [Streptomyces sp. NPDC001970]
MLAAACRHAGLDGVGASLIRLGENALFRLVAHPVVVRIARSTKYPEPARGDVRVSRWLSDEGFPKVATAEQLRQLVLAGRADAQTSVTRASVTTFADGAGRPPRGRPPKQRVLPVRLRDVGHLRGWKKEVALPVAGTFTASARGSLRADVVLAAPDSRSCASGCSSLHNLSVAAGVLLQDQR